MRRNRNAPLGRTQKLVLQLIALKERPPSVRDLGYSWPGLSESAARSAVYRLADRGLVDAAGWDSTDGRTYCLTERGIEAERKASGLGPLDEDEL